MLNKNSPKKTYKYFCGNCTYKCFKQSDYNKHLLTAKHIRLNNVNNLSPTSNNLFQCICGKVYRQQSGLSRHKRMCDNQSDPVKTVGDDKKSGHQPIHDADCNKITPNEIFTLIKQNQEFKELIIEQNKTIIELSKRTNIQNNTTNNNQKFNLNFFLNNTCKDAINMSEFIEDMEINFEDIENIGKNGYVIGMTDMILSRIKQLDVTKRPLHCTDLKRETMYIKDNNEWEKDTPDNKKLHKMMSIISKRNYSTIPLWRDEHPECQNMKHPHCDFSVDMLRNVLGDIGEAQIKLDNKVIKNISKCILVEK
jgi:hypothetical protein